MGLSDLMTMAEVAATRVGKYIAKGKTRLEITSEKRPLTKIDDKAFRQEVWTRDGHRCRCCRRKVLKTIARVPERAEVHHIHGRVGDLRFESRAAVGVCAFCHEKLTGRVNEHRLVIVSTKTFVTRQGEFTDARFPIIFREVK